MVTDGGLLQVGTESNPFQHKATITLSGHVLDKEMPIYGTKVIAIRNGTLELHGRFLFASKIYLDLKYLNGCKVIGRNM